MQSVRKRSKPVHISGYWSIFSARFSWTNHIGLCYLYREKAQRANGKLEGEIRFSLHLLPIVLQFVYFTLTFKLKLQRGGNSYPSSHH